MLESYVLEGALVRAPAMQQALELCWLYAPIGEPVLFVGPVGSGKTMLARVLHDASGRRGSFVVVGGGDLGGELYQNALFGHERGAYTGALTKEQGLLAQASSGTLLLDDLAQMPLPAQRAVLRVLDERLYRPLGSSREERCHCRWLFATTVPPRALIDEGRMLQDFQSRLGALTIEVPPLATRRADILPLARLHAERFLLQVYRRAARVVLDDEVERLLLAYSWPENARELRNVMRRAAVHAAHDGPDITIRPVHLPTDLLVFDPAAEAGRKPVTPALVHRTWIEADRNQAETARRLDLHRNTVARHLQRHAGRKT